MEYPWIKYVTWESLPNDDMRILASIVGLEATAKIMCELEGIMLVIPSKAVIDAKIKYIKEHYDGSKNSRVELSKQCHLTENYVFRALSQHKKK